MSGMHFLRPDFLFLIIPFFILILFLVRRSHQSAGPWKNLCSKDLLPYVLAKKDKRHYFSYLLAAFTLFLLIIGISGPSWQQIAQPLIKQNTGLVIALDLSPTMDAQDIKPSRLQRAIYKINDLLEIHQEGQTALIAFSGNPFVVTPLTDDSKTIKNLLPVLDTNIMPSPGHRADLAIAKASDLLKQSGINNGSILLVTSELSNQEMEASIAIAKQQGLPISVLAIGTDEAVPIPQRGGGFIKDSKGALVMAALSKKNLNKLSESTGGFFATITLDDNDLHQLAHSFSANTTSATHEKTELKQNKWHDQGYLFVLLALPFASLLFRRGILAILFIITIITPHMAQALSFDDFWKTKDQQAQQMFQQEKYQEANDLFQNKEWQAICSYKLEDYDRAAQLFEDIPTVEGLFNFGTAKAKLGDFQSALDAYNKVLSLQPEHEDAIYNKNIIEEFLKQNKQDQSQNKQDQNQNNKKNNKKQRQNQKTEKQEKQEQEKQEQEKQEQEKQEQEKQENKQEDSKEGQSQDQEEGQDRDRNQEQGQEQGQTAEADKQNIDELKDQYREKIDREMEKEKSQREEVAQVSQEEAQSKDDPQWHIDERWLKRVQDDPAGLMRRKFQQQYQQQQKAK